MLTSPLASSNQSRPYQVRLKQCRLFSLLNGESANTGVDLSSSILSIDIYESIFDNTISASLHLQETEGLIERLPIVGTEFVLLEFEIDRINEQQSIESQNYRRVFRVRKVGDQNFVRHEMREYTLELVTQEFINSLSKRITQHYTGAIQRSLNDIFTQHLQIDSKRIRRIEPCRGEADVVLPNYTPLQAINFFSTIALAKDPPDENSFLFYETLDGFYFTSLRTLFAQPAAVSYRINGNEIVGASRVDANVAFNSISSFRQDQTFDLTHDIVTGMLRSKMIYLDFFSREWKEEDSRYTESFGQTSHLDQFPVYPDNFDQSVSKSAKIFIVPTNVATATKNPIGVKEVMSEMNIHKAVVLRNRQLKELSHLRAKLRVPGQPRIRAGAIIELIYPSTRGMQGTTGASANEPMPALKTPLHSGKHLVTRVHHNLTMTAPNSLQYEMDIEVVRNAFGASIPAFKKNAKD